MIKKYAGSALTESLIVSTIVLLALLVPIPGLGESALTFLVNALRGFQANAIYLISMP
ncbi:MAG: hypothetical protein AB8B63_15515 [Granulosicoccus sp.]